jgi:hypothetical protein
LCILSTSAALRGQHTVLCNPRWLPTSGLTEFAVCWGGAGFKPRTTDLQSGALPLNHLSNLDLKKLLLHKYNSYQIYFISFILCFRMKLTHSDGTKHQLFNKIKESPEKRHRVRLADERAGFFS